MLINYAVTSSLFIEVRQLCIYVYAYIVIASKPNHQPIRIPSHLLVQEPLFIPRNNTFIRNFENWGGGEEDRKWDREPL